MVEFQVEGMDDVRKKLRKLRRSAEALNGKHDIPLTELFPARFLRESTEFENLESMFEASGFVIESREDFENIPDDEWDRFIAEHTRFSSWKEMMSEAVGEWAARRLGF